MPVIQGLGTTISKGGTLIGGLTDISGVDMSADQIDVTTLDSTGGYKTYIAGFKDAGEVGLSGFFNSGDSGQTAMVTSFNSGIEDIYIVTFPGGVTWTFNGIVTKLTTGASVADPVKFETTIKVTSQPILGLTQSAGITALALTGGTGGTVVPTVAAGTYGYTFIQSTGTSLTITVTAASHTIKLYADDVYVQDLTTAVASSAIAFGSVQMAKKLTIVAYEATKSPRVYNVMAVRTT